jgi:hypothetical protein
MLFEQTLKQKVQKYKIVLIYLFSQYYCNETPRTLNGTQSDFLVLHVKALSNLYLKEKLITSLHVYINWKKLISKFGESFCHVLHNRSRMNLD